MIPDNPVSRFLTTEWLNVYDCLFIPELRDERKAIEKILSWELKGSYISDAVICTRLFLEASVAEKEFHSIDGACLEETDKTRELQMLYTVAIVRFVETFLNKKNNENHKKDPVYEKFYNEIRTCYQRITDCKELLCLDLLRNASKACFDCLYVNYWNFHTESIRSRVMTVAYCRQLASGLVTVIYDLESLLPSDPHMEASLTSLLTSIASRKHITSSIPTLNQLIQCITMVVGLKRKETMRALRRFKLLEVLSEPAFVNATSWCQTLRDALPPCLNFIESILHSNSHENVTLSFFKDFLFLVYDPDLVSNAPIVIAVFWILSRVSVTLVDKLVLYLTYAITGLHLDKDDLLVDELLSSNFSQYFHSLSLSSQGVSCFDYESFSLWIRTMNVSNEQEKQLKLHLGSPIGSQCRFLSWLRCLVLLPGVNHSTHDVVGLPDSIDFLMHLFCGPQVDTFVHQSSSASFNTTYRHSAFVTGGSKDSFNKRFLSALTTTQSRIIASCRCLLDFLAHVSVCYLSKKELVSENGLRGLLRLFKDIDVSKAKNIEGPFMNWLNRRLEYPVNAGPISKRNIMQRLFSSTERRSFSDGEYKRHIGASLYDEFYSRLLSRRTKLQQSNSSGCQASMCETLPPSCVGKESNTTVAKLKSLSSLKESGSTESNSTLDCYMDCQIDSTCIPAQLNLSVLDGSSSLPSNDFLPSCLRSKRALGLSHHSVSCKRQRDLDPQSFPAMESLSALLSPSSDDSMYFSKSH